MWSTDFNCHVRLQSFHTPQEPLPFSLALGIQDCYAHKLYRFERLFVVLDDIDNPVDSDFLAIVDLENLKLWHTNGAEDIVFGV